VDDLDLEASYRPDENTAIEAMSPYLNIIDSGNLGSGKSTTTKSIFSG